MGIQSGLPASGHHEEIARVLRSRKQTQAFYDRISRIYDFMAERSERPLRAAGLKLLAPQPGERVLEIGCGTGRCLTALAKATSPQGRVFGIDLSMEMLRKSKGHLHSHVPSPNLDLICGDATIMPFPAAVVDAVLTSFTLELLDTPDIPRFLDECRRILLPGGRIVVVAMSKAGKRSAMLRTFEWTHRHFPQILDCRPIFARKALEESGFHIESASLQKMWIPVEIVLATSGRYPN
jgi:ubiquinone/menaquinone biosynthesis C-methylase UbiE